MPYLNHFFSVSIFIFLSIPNSPLLLCLTLSFLPSSAGAVRIVINSRSFYPPCWNIFPFLFSLLRDSERNRLTPRRSDERVYRDDQEWRTLKISTPNGLSESPRETSLDSGGLGAHTPVWNLKGSVSSPEFVRAP